MSDYITLHMSDGRKIIAKPEKLRVFSPTVGYIEDAGGVSWKLNGYGITRPDFAEGLIIVNLDHVLYIWPSDKDDINHAINHGY